MFVTEKECLSSDTVVGGDLGFFPVEMKGLLNNIGGGGGGAILPGAVMACELDLSQEGCEFDSSP